MPRRCVRTSTCKACVPELKRIPYMVIVGEKEEAEGLVSMRQQGGGEQRTMTIQEFIDKINAEVAEQTRNF